MRRLALLVTLVCAGSLIPTQLQAGSAVPEFRICADFMGYAKLAVLHDQHFVNVKLSPARYRVAS